MPGDPGWCSLLDSNQRPAEWITPILGHRIRLKLHRSAY